MRHAVTPHKLTDSQRRQRADLKQRYSLEPDSFQNKSGYTDGQLSDVMDLQRSQVQHGVPVVPFTASTPAVSVGGSRLFKAKSESDLSGFGKPQSVADVLGSQWADALQNPTQESISQAHETLTKMHYTFMGYHGTNKAGGNAMMAQGLHPGKIGSGGGTARGSGFYGAGYPDYAKEYAEVASADQDNLHPKTFQPMPYSGDSGIPQVMRVYLKDAGAMKHGRDFNWGIESSAGDPNFDRRVDAANSHNVPSTQEHRGIQANKRFLEMVVAPHRFDKMVVIPSVDPDLEHTKLGGVKWRPHEYHHTGLKD